MGIDQLKLHSVQPGYQKNLQRPTKTQAAKQGKKTRSNLSTKSTHKTTIHRTCNIHIMICMRLSRKICHLGQQLSWQISIVPQHHAQPISLWKSSIRDLQVHRPSQLSGLQISPGHDTNILFKSASLLAHGRAQQKLPGSSNPEAQTDWENYRPEICEDARTCNNFTLPHWYQSKALRVANPSPPILLQTVVNQRQSTEKGLNEHYSESQILKSKLNPAFRSQGYSDLPSLRYTSAQPTRDVALLQNDVA
ncbi:outer envelope protein 61, chloroplastic-like [Dorcoceras hygrometricum]|uniref:Outer envelope protein 61, chloroplastic-like n=1 Tax=Dorcoceras hygrometricum TaxID=472368 RepID=A0A2Z7ADF7_9LAMI|nr:outer envelope protein 61, chloroplastic-like [Dorcoceras hygrometricum]